MPFLHGIAGTASVAAVDAASFASDAGVAVVAVVVVVAVVDDGDDDVVAAVSRPSFAENGSSYFVVSEFGAAFEVGVVVVVVVAAGYDAEVADDGTDGVNDEDANDAD